MEHDNFGPLVDCAWSALPLGGAPGPSTLTYSVSTASWRLPRCAPLSPGAVSTPSWRRTLTWPSPSWRRHASQCQTAFCCTKLLAIREDAGRPVCVPLKHPSITNQTGTQTNVVIPQTRALKRGSTPSWRRQASRTQLSRNGEIIERLLKHTAEVTLFLEASSRPSQEAEFANSLRQESSCTSVSFQEDISE